MARHLSASGLEMALPVPPAFTRLFYSSTKIPDPQIQDGDTGLNRSVDAFVQQGRGNKRPQIHFVNIFAAGLAMKECKSASLDWFGLPDGLLGRSRSALDARRGTTAVLGS